MPVNPIVPECCEVREIFAIGGNERMVNTFNFNIGDDPFDATVAADITGAIATAYNDNIAPVLSNTVSLLAQYITDLRELNGTQFVTGTLDTGALSDNPLPSQTAACITWRTDTRGKSFRGRSYLGGFTEAGSSGQSPTSTVYDAVVAFASDLITGAQTAGWPLSIVSRYHQVVPGTPPTVPRVTNLITQVTSSTVDAAWKTQRRRALKG